MRHIGYAGVFIRLIISPTDALSALTGCGGIWHNCRFRGVQRLVRHRHVRLLFEGGNAGPGASNRPLPALLRRVAETGKASHARWLCLTSGSGADMVAVVPRHVVLLCVLARARHRVRRGITLRDQMVCIITFLFLS